MSNDNLNIWLQNILNQYEIDSTNEYVGFYREEDNEKLSKILAIFHKELNNLLEYLNYRLEYGHYTAHESRQLIKLIEDIEKLKKVASKSNIDIEINTYYQETINKCKLFLSQSGGSSIPEDFKRIDIIDYDRIFNIIEQHSIEIKNRNTEYRIKSIGEGSYAKVFKYKDTQYNRVFVIKRANQGLRLDELERFKLEFELMKKLNSPYIVEVYNFDEVKYEYVMEYMDETLEEYIRKNNTKLNVKDRINMVRQILKAFKYIHSKNILHRDISTKNILVKKYDDVLVVKVCDFGLVKIPGSDLTRKGTEIKGSLNDHKLLEIQGFENFRIEHETYALTKLIYFVMTGKETLEKYNNTKYKDFVSKGISDRIDNRYKSIEDLESSFNTLVMQLNKN